MVKSAPDSDGPGKRKKRREMAVQEAQALYGDILGVATPWFSTAHNDILAGYAVSKISAVAELLGLHPDELALRCGLSRTTFKRKLANPSAKLDPVASDVLARHLLLFKAALTAFWNDSDYAKTWLHARQRGLDWEVPLDFAKTSAGTALVETLMGQISQGSYV